MRRLAIIFSFSALLMACGDAGPSPVGAELPAPVQGQGQGPTVSPQVSEIVVTKIDRHCTDSCCATVDSKGNCTSWVLCCAPGAASASSPAEGDPDQPVVVGR